MSRIGKRPLAIPSGVEVDVKGNVVTVKGAKGTLNYAFLPEITVTIEGSTITVGRKGDSDNARARHGLTRQLIANMIEGVSNGFMKKLEIIGVGYKAQPKGKSVSLQLGYSHPIEYKAPEGVTIETDAQNKNVLVISGADKQKVGQTAAEIRSFRPPEPYKGKGIRYSDEIVVRKAGKAAASAGTKAA